VFRVTLTPSEESRSGRVVSTSQRRGNRPPGVKWEPAGPTRSLFGNLRPSDRTLNTGWGEPRLHSLRSISKKKEGCPLHQAGGEGGNIWLLWKERTMGGGVGRGKVGVGEKVKNKESMQDYYLGGGGKGKKDVGDTGRGEKRRGKGEEREEGW